MEQSRAQDWSTVVKDQGIKDGRVVEETWVYLMGVTRGEARCVVKVCQVSRGQGCVAFETLSGFENKSKGGEE